VRLRTSRDEGGVLPFEQGLFLVRYTFDPLLDHGPEHGLQVYGVFVGIQCVGVGGKWVRSLLLCVVHSDEVHECVCVCVRVCV
jgi:hypothetical protein